MSKLHQQSTHTLKLAVHNIILSPCSRWEDASEVAQNCEMSQSCMQVWTRGRPCMHAARTLKFNIGHYGQKRKQTLGGGGGGGGG